jgi:hypothetical protein
MILIVGKNALDAIHWADLLENKRTAKVLDDPRQVRGYEKGTVCLLTPGYKESRVFEDRKAWNYINNVYNVIQCIGGT